MCSLARAQCRNNSVAFSMHMTPKKSNPGLFVCIFSLLKTTLVGWLENRWTNFVLQRKIIFYITVSEKMEQKILLTTITQRHAYIFYPLPLCGFYPHQSYSIGLARSLLLLNLNFLLSIPKSKGRFFLLVSPTKSYHS